MRTCAIVNPVAGSGRATTLWPELEPRLRAASTSFTDRWTTGTGSGEQMSRTALQDGIERVVAVGGDGTLHEVVNGFFDGDTAINPKAVLTHIPCGSGSDFRRTLGVPVGLPAADQLASDRIDRLDVIRVECSQENGEMMSRSVINVASWGLSGAVVRRTSKSDRVLPPRLHYLAGALRALATDRPAPVELTLDGDTLGPSALRLGAVANGHTFAAGLPIAPRATPHDGLFDLTLLHDVSVPVLLRHVHRFYRGSHTTLSYVSTHRGHTLTVKPLEQSRPVWMEGDGEVLGCLPATFEMVPEAIRVQYRASRPPSRVHEHAPCRGPHEECLRSQTVENLEWETPTCLNPQSKTTAPRSHSISTGPRSTKQSISPTARCAWPKIEVEID